MSPAATVLAWLASLAPLLLERAGWLDLGAAGADSTPRLGLCALAWIALAGAPRAQEKDFDPRRWWGSTMACLPVIALAVALDQASGAVAAGSWIAAASAAGFVALGALAAELARKDARARRAHAALWLVFVLGLPLFAAALAWGARTGSSLAPAWATRAASFSPLSWSLASAQAAASPFAALAAVVALCAASALSSRRAPP